ncbi:MAG: flagellar basal body P-ring formation chaperone FlgA [Pseudomonadota bacterium]
MRRALLLLALLIGTAPVAADAPPPGAAAAPPPTHLVATRPIRSRTVLGPADVAATDGHVPGALVLPAEAVGLETRVALYAGRPVHPGDLGPPALVERNQIVTLSFLRGALAIRTEGRALDRGGAGERVRVMNLSSRQIVIGSVTGHQMVEVGP